MLNRIRWWIGWPLWWLIAPHAEALCGNYTDRLVDEDQLNAEISYVQHEVSMLEDEVNDLRGEIE